MANLASMIEKYSLANNQSLLAAGSTMFTAMIPFLRANVTTKSIEKTTGGIQEPFTSIRKVFEDVVNVFKGINRENEKQNTIFDRIERSEDEKRQERINIIRQTSIKQDTDEEETESGRSSSIILSIIRRILSTIVGAFRRLVGAIITLARNIARILLFTIRIIGILRRRTPIGLLVSILGSSLGVFEPFERLTSALENFVNEPEPTAGQSSGTPQRGNEINRGQAPELPSGDFNTELTNVSQRLGIRAEDLLLVMASESGLGVYAPDAAAARRNPTSSATGLIQFTERTAGMLGTTTDELQRMSAAQQMRYVEEYFRRVGLPRGANAATIYAYVFLPGRANNADGVLTRAGENYYESNRILDANRDGVITINDLGEVLRGRQNRAYRLPETNTPTQTNAEISGSQTGRQSSNRIQSGVTYAATSSNIRIPPSYNGSSSEIYILPMVARA